MRTIANKLQHQYMKERQIQLRQKGMTKAESWAHEHLKQTGFRWTFQAVHGCRVFDFWNHHLGIAVEIDGPEHDAEYDSARDRYNFYRSAILVLRVQNFNEAQMNQALDVIAKSETLSARKASIIAEAGLPSDSNLEAVLKIYGIQKAHTKWQPKKIQV